MGVFLASTPLQWKYCMVKDNSITNITVKTAIEICYCDIGDVSEDSNLCDL